MRLSYTDSEIGGYPSCKLLYLERMNCPSGDTKLVQIMDTAFSDAAQRAGARLVCRAGCTQCCFGAFAINALDALRLHTGINALRTQNPAMAAEIEQRAEAWIAEFAGEFPGDAKSGRLGDSDEEQERFEEFANDAACPALDPATGRCTVYAWRPMTCRVFGPPVRMGEGDALGHCELCFEGASEADVAACEMDVPHELEAELLHEVEQTAGTKGETVVAFALRSRKGEREV
jgi:Fe-S-cluster containining protein